MSFTRHEASLSAGPLPYLAGGDGPALVYIHAAGGPAETDFLHGLAAAHRVLVPILPGFSGTPPLPGIDGVTALGELVAEFVQKIVGKSADVMGASFGGWIALWLAIRHPEIVEQLVLEAPAGLRFGMDANSMTVEEMRASLFLYPEKAARTAAPPEIAAGNGKAAAGYMKGVFVDEALARQVTTIAARTLVLMGTADRIIPQAAGHYLAAHMPACHLAYVYNAAHAIEVDQPEAALRLVRDFLERGDAFIVKPGDVAA